MTRWLVVLTTALVGPASASGPRVICPIQASTGWTTLTEPGVRVTCGKSSRIGDERKCAVLTVAPADAQPWTAWANDVPASLVKTLKHGEVLLVGGSTVRIFTRNTPGKDDQFGPPPPFVQPLMKLSDDERARLPADPCNNRTYLAGMRLDGDDHFILRLEFDGLDPRTRNPRPPIELRVAIADGAATRLEKAGPAPDKEPAPFKRPPQANQPAKTTESGDFCGHGSGLFTLGALGWTRALARRRKR